jgi:hypothetical protein
MSFTIYRVLGKYGDNCGTFLSHAEAGRFIDWIVKDEPDFDPTVEEQQVFQTLEDHYLYKNEMEYKDQENVIEDDEDLIWA